MARIESCGRTILGGVAAAALLVTRGAAAQPSVPEPPPPAEPWYEAVQLRAFADTFASVNWAFPKPPSYQPPTRRYDGQQGFGLAWVGLDAVFAPEPVGGTLNLRWGPMATRHAGADAGTALEVVKQAHVAWRPGGGPVTLEIGKFDAFVGAEAPESQDDFNTTRGLLYSFAQPRFHTGLRVTAELVPELTLTTLVSNGLDRSVDNNVGKTFGVGIGVNPSDGFAANLAWLGGPEQPDSLEVKCTAGTRYEPDAGTCAPSAGTPAQSWVVDRGGANDFEAWRHLFDLTLTVQPMETLALALNADYGVEGVRNPDTSVAADPEAHRWYGAALLGRAQLDETWALAARGEYLVDEQGRALGAALPDGTPVTDVRLASGTVTVEARPTESLILRLENRADFVLDAKPVDEIYQESVRGSGSRLITTTLGVVVTTH